jgi:hypothetical protein
MLRHVAYKNRRFGQTYRLHTADATDQRNLGKSPPPFEIAKLLACIVIGKSAFTQRFGNSNWQGMSKTGKTSFVREY